MEDLLKEFGDKIDAIKNAQISQDVIDAMKQEAEALKVKVGENEAFKTRIEALTEEVSQLKENTLKAVTYSKKSILEQVGDFVKENAEEIAKIQKSGAGNLELIFKHDGELAKIENGVTKAATTVSTGNTSNVSVPNALGAQIAPPANANLREIMILDACTTINTSQAQLAYTETVPKDGDSAYTAEGTAKPQIDFNTVTRFATVYKPAAWTELTEEIVTDIPQIQQIAEDLLFRKHNLKKAKAILNGDGTGANPTGATVIGRTFVAGSMALAVSNPNIVDVINACRTDIAMTHNFTDETPYMANYVALNPVDFYIQLLAVKDGFGRPLYPDAQFMQSINLPNGVTIIQDEAVAVGKILVADMKKMNISNYVPYSVRIGWINDNFITNKFCIVGESRHHQFVKNFDKKAFIYDTIATIKTAITKA